jgi:hypothetical protein
MKQRLAGGWLVVTGLFLPLTAYGQAPPATMPSAPASAAIAPGPAPEVRVEGTRPAPPVLINPLELYDSDFVTRTDAFTADEVLGQLPTVLPGTQQVVFIDGHESTVDISTIPAARIERIEVSTSGVMPDGRPRIVGTVINVILKQKYNGANVGARHRDTEQGGGGQSQFNAFGGYTLGKLTGTLNLVHREQDPLLARERDFSQFQDHTAEGGADYRAPYGTAPVVEAVTGPLNGVTDSNGAPASIALAPQTSPNHPLAPEDFVAAPAGTIRPAGLRHFNTADFLYLVAPSKTDNANGDLTYSLTPKTKLRAGYAFSRTTSDQSGPPPVTPVSPVAVVPAAYNPFGQDVEIGLVQSGFGAVQRETSSKRRSGFIAAEGSFTETWTWEAQFDLNQRVFDSETHDLDPAKFAAALAAPDPAERFNPFADTGPGSANAVLYPSLATVRRSSGTADDSRQRVDSRGQLSDGWVGPVTAHVEVDRRDNDSRQSIDPVESIEPRALSRSRLSALRVAADLTVPAFKVRELESPATLTLSGYSSRDSQQFDQQTPVVFQSSRLNVRTQVLNGLLDIPWTAPADERRGAYQLNTQLGLGVGRTEGQSILSENSGVLWSPAKPLTLRGEYSKELTPAPLALFPLTVDYNQTLIDRERGGSIASNVQVISNQPDARNPPLVSRLMLSAEWAPPWIAKLKLVMTYEDVTQKGQQRNFSAQDILDNEAALTGRVTRLPPTDADLAVGEPGAIEQVDITPFNGGQREDRDLIFFAQFTGTSPGLGTLTLRSYAKRVLSSRNELIAGTPIVSTDDSEAPPEWTASGQARWQRRKWDAAASYSYTSGGFYAGLPYSSFGTLDTRVGYQLDKPLGGWLGRALRIGAGIQNLLNKAPPFANTITGIRGGSPLGRTYEVTVRSLIGD